MAELLKLAEKFGAWSIPNSQSIRACPINFRRDIQHGQARRRPGRPAVARQSRERHGQYGAVFRLAGFGRGGKPDVGEGWRFRLVGPLEVRHDGVPVPIAAAKQRVLIAVLALAAGEPVTVERLIACPWDDQPALVADVGHILHTADVLDSLGHPHAALGEFEQARAVWGKALELYRQQGRDRSADRVRQQLDHAVYSLGWASRCQEQRSLQGLEVRGQRESKR